MDYLRKRFNIRTVPVCFLILVKCTSNTASPVPLDCPSCPPGFYNDPGCFSSGFSACHPCKPGTYAATPGVRGHCDPCSKCGDGLFELHVCTSISDVFCEDCAWKGAEDNPDYLKKCVKYESSFLFGRETPIKNLGTSNSRHGKHHRRINHRSARRHHNYLDIMLGDQPSRALDPDDNTNQSSLKEDNQDKDKAITHEKPINKNQLRGLTAPASEEDKQTGSDQSDLTRAENTEGGKPEVEADEEESGQVGEDSLFDYIFKSDFSALSQTDPADEVGSGEDDKQDIGGMFGSGEESILPESTVFPQPETTSDKKGIRIINEGIDEDVKETTAGEKQATEAVTETFTVEIAPVQQGGSLAAWIIVVIILSIAVVFFFLGFLVYWVGYKKKFFRSQKQSRKYSPVTNGTNGANGSEMIRMYSQIDYGQRRSQHVTTFKDKAQETKDVNEKTAFVPMEDKTDRPAIPIPEINIQQDIPTAMASPINIVPSEIDVDESLEKDELRFSPGLPFDWDIINTGNTIKMRPRDDNSEADPLMCTLTGGVLGRKTFTLDHLHFHWGSDDTKGSEHTIDGQPFPAEVHVVYWNSSDYPSNSAASRSDGGLAVVAILIKTMSIPNLSLKPLIDSLSSIELKGESRNISGQAIDLLSFLPASHLDYWSYLGCDTDAATRPATWIVLREKIELSKTQLLSFRKLRNHERGESHGAEAGVDDFLVDNFRSVQPLGDRVIRASFL